MGEGRKCFSRAEGGGAGIKRVELVLTLELKCFSNTDRVGGGGVQNVSTL